MAYAYTHSVHTPAVVIDDERAACEMTRYLISMGHRRIGVLGGRENNIHTRSRLRGYQKALFEENILYNPEWVRYGGLGEGIRFPVGGKPAERRRDGCFLYE